MLNDLYLPTTLSALSRPISRLTSMFWASSRSESSVRPADPDGSYIWLKPSIRPDDCCGWSAPHRHLSISLIRKRQDEQEADTATMTKIENELETDLKILTSLRDWDARESVKKGLTANPRTDLQYLTETAKKIIKLKTAGTKLEGLPLVVDSDDSPTLPSRWRLSGATEDTKDGYERLKRYSNGWKDLRQAGKNLKSHRKAVERPIHLHGAVPREPDTPAEHCCVDTITAGGLEYLHRKLLEAGQLSGGETDEEFSEARDGQSSKSSEGGDDFWDCQQSISGENNLLL